MARALLLAALLVGLVAAPALAGEPAHASAPSASHAGPGHAAEGAGDGHAEEHGEPIVAKIVNTVIFFGLLGWFAGPWIVAQFRTRKSLIASELGAARAAREMAEAKLAEVEARLAEVAGEVEGILEKAGKQAEAEKDRIIAAAKNEAGRILEQAETQVSELEARASHRLRGEAADLAVKLARGLVTKELADADRARLFDKYLDGLQEAAG